MQNFLQYRIYTDPSWAPSQGNLPFLSPFWFESEFIKHVYYEQNHQHDKYFAADELFMIYKMSIEISMQNIVGGVM